MKQQLKQIYDDLSNGRLSQQQALEKIRSIKLQQQGNGTGALLVTPVWQPSGIEVSAGASKFEFAEHHVIRCESEQQKTIPHRYTDRALECFERIQAIL